MSNQGTPRYTPQGIVWDNATEPAQPAQPVSAPAIQREYCYTISDGKGEFIAHVKVRWHGTALWIDDLWCHADHRRKGYGRSLVAAALDDWGNQEIYLSIYPYTDQPMNAAELAAFYAAFGFVATEVPGVMKRSAI